MLFFFICMIPEDFELENYMTIKESANIFNKENVNLDQLKIISQSVRLNSITMLNTQVSAESLEYFMKILDELKVVIDHRMDHRAGFARIGLSNDDGMRDDIRRSNVFIGVNLWHLPNNKDYQKVVERMVDLEDYKVSEDLLKDLAN